MSDSAEKRMSRFRHAAWTLVAVAALAAAPARLDAQDASRQPPHITVPGEATVKIAPDVARLRAGVVTEAKSARESAEANARIMTAVMASIKAMGVPDKDVQTQRYLIQPVYGGGPSGGGNRITGFQATNTVVLTIRETDKVANLVDGLVAAGANTFGMLEFTVSDRSGALDKARAEAVADARRKAELYARAAGVTLGRPITIVESGSGPAPHADFMRTAAAPSQTPIAPGETSLHVSITATFELQH